MCIQKWLRLVPDKEIPPRIRVSLGSAIVLGLLSGKLDAAPTTAYLMTYKRGRCTANCGFCPQARKSHSRGDMLSRVSWPVFATMHLLNRLRRTANDGKIKRVCIQALNYPEVFAHLTALIKAIQERVNVPISVSIQPLSADNIRLLADAETERIGIPLDAATEEIFDRTKGSSAGGPYTWKRQLKLLEKAVRIFGKGRVSTHLIVGLGETEKEVIQIVQQCVDMGVLPALFAFTPIPGTALNNKPQPVIQSYRRIQVARYLVVHGIAGYEDMRFDEEGHINNFGVSEQTLLQIAKTSSPFLTSGCPNCNRPYYNEKPCGPIYNYPKDLTEEDFALIRKQLDLKEA